MARSGWGTVRPSCLGLVSVVGSCELTSSPVAERTEMPRTETRSPFIAPEIAVPEPSEAAAGPSELAAEFAEPAVVWSLGIFCYTLLAGYPPFESSNTMCPFFKDYSTMNRLACPVHFSAPTIALLCSLRADLPYIPWLPRWQSSASMAIVGTGNNKQFADRRAGCCRW